MLFIFQIIMSVFDTIESITVWNGYSKNIPIQLIGKRENKINSSAVTL